MKESRSAHVCRGRALLFFRKLGDSALILFYNLIYLRGSELHVCYLLLDTLPLGRPFTLINTTDSSYL